MTNAARSLLALMAATAGCGNDELLRSNATADSGTVSAADADGTLFVLPGYYRKLENRLELLVDGGVLPLSLAPQGGHFAFVSARVKNATVSTLAVRVSFFDAESGALLMREEGSGPMAPSPGDPDALEPSELVRGAVAHMAACPSETPPGFFGRAIDVAIEVSEPPPASRSGSGSVRVTSACSEGTPFQKAYCECECRPDYEPALCAEFH